MPRISGTRPATVKKPAASKPSAPAKQPKKTQSNGWQPAGSEAGGSRNTRPYAAPSSSFGGGEL